MSVAELRKKFESDAQDTEKPVVEHEVVTKGFVAEKVSALENPQAVDPKTVQFTSEREGDFFAAVQQHSLELLSDGKDLLRVEAAVRAAHPDIGDAIVNLSLSSFGDVAPLTERALLSLSEQARILFSTRNVSNHKINFSVSLDDANLHTVGFELCFFLPQPRLYEDFRAACAKALQLDNSSGLSTAVALDSDGTLVISGDKQLEEFLNELIRSDTTKVPHVVVSVASKAEKQSVRIVASLIGELESREAAFDFEFALSDFQLLDTLREAIRSELELDQKQQISLVAVVDGCSFTLSEKVLVEVLSQKHQDEIRVEVQAVNAATYRQATVFCRFATSTDEDEAAVTFRYTLVESSLLQALCCEIAGELEAEFDRTKLTCVSGDQLIIVASDTILRELLNGGQELHLLLNPVQSKTAVERTKQISCLLGGEEATFQFSYSLLDGGLLENFRAECRAETDLMPSDKIILTAVVDDSQIPIDRDSTLLELLSHDGPLVVLVEEVRAAPKQIVKQKDVTCTLGTDTVTFVFTFSVQQDGLLEHLYGEIKDELDLLPNEEIIITLAQQEDDASIEVGTDRILRDILSDVERLVFTVALKKKKGQRQQARQATVLCKSGSDEVRCEITYRENDCVSVLLQQEIRHELELDGTVVVTFTDVEGGPVDENALRRLLDQGTTAVLNVVLPKSQRDTLEEMPLNRNAELHALFYDWQDILGETFDASDLRLVLQNVKQDGKPLPPGDAIFGKVAEFANSGSSRRTEVDLLPFLGSMTAHYADADVSTLCHLCRDVISFVVDVSPQFRYRRAVSQVFRTISVNDSVNLSQLLGLLSKAGVEESITGTVIEGFGEQLSLRDFRAILEQLFGESVQDVADLITAAQDAAPTTSRRGEREVHLLRRQRLLSEVRHALDGTSTDQFNAIPVGSLKLCIAALLSPNTFSSSTQASRLAVAEKWFAEKISTEVAAHNFLSELTSFKSSGMDEIALHEVSALLVSTELDPSFLLSVSPASCALAMWAIAAAQLVCHNRRLMFPHVLSADQQPLCARKPEGPKGVSAPRLLRNLYEERDDQVVANYSPNSGVPRFEPRLRHLCNDLQITDAQFPITYRQFANRQLSEAPSPPS